MASTVAITPFDTIQLGREAVKGTLVPATRRLVGAGVLKETQDRYYSGYPRGVNTTVGGDGVLTMKECEFEFETELCPQELLWALLTGIKGNITPTGAGADKTWTWAPQLTSEATLDTMTVEFALSDGTTNHIYAEAGYGMITGYTIDWEYNQVAKMSMRGFARARQTGSPTGALTPYPNRQILVSPLAKLYIDSTYAGIGVTQVTSVVRSMKLDVQTFAAPDYTIDGRTDQDFVSHRLTPLQLTVSVTAELNATIATEFGNWRAGTRRYIRIDSDGITLGASNYRVRHDISCRIIGTPQFSDDDGQRLVTLELEGVYDDTATKIADIVVICDLASVANL